MAQKISITIADMVNERINHLMQLNNTSNRSEFIEELIRHGIEVHENTRRKDGQN